MRLHLQQPHKLQKLNRMLANLSNTAEAEGPVKVNTEKFLEVLVTLILISNFLPFCPLLAKVMQY